MEAKRLSWWVGVILLFGMLALPRPGWACIFAGPARIEDQARAAGSIILGTVVETKTYSGANGSIYTDAILLQKLTLNTT